MNSSNIIGRLTATPELKKTQSGTSVCSFTVAVIRRVKKGEETETDFIDCVAWKAKAEFLCKYFEKGSMIAVSGRLQTRNYEDKNGRKIKVTEIVADDISFCEGKKPKAEPNIAPPTDEGVMQEIPDDEDYPF